MMDSSIWSLCATFKGTKVTAPIGIPTCFSPSLRWSFIMMETATSQKSAKNSALLFPNQVIRTDDLARAMADVVVQKNCRTQESSFLNRDIRAKVESFHPNGRNVDAVVDGGVRVTFLTHHYYFGGPATLDGGGPVDSRATSSGSINIWRGSLVPFWSRCNRVSAAISPILRSGC
jgi:hypothetical protein